MPPPLPRLETMGSPVGCSPIARRPSPDGRRVGSSKKLSRPAQGSLALRPAHLPPGLYPGCSEGFSRILDCIDCSGGYRGAPTIPRAGLPPAGHRDPEDSLCLVTLAQNEPPFVTHCRGLFGGRPSNAAGWTFSTPQGATMRPLAARLGQHRAVGGRPRCASRPGLCRIAANELQSRYGSFEVGGEISPRGGRQQAPLRLELSQRDCRAPARNRFGPHRVAPVGRGFVQAGCI